MNRTIKIPSLNEGKEFTIPKRKNKHRLSMLEKMLELPEKLKNDIEYRNTMESIYIVYFVLRDIFPKITVDEIKELEPEETMEITRILYNIEPKKFDELMKGNFPNLRQKKQ